MELRIRIDIYDIDEEEVARGLQSYYASIWPKTQVARLSVIPIVSCLLSWNAYNDL